MLELESHKSLTSGFVLTLLLRIVSVTALIALPIYMQDALHVPVYLLGLYVALLWIGNAVGTGMTVLVVRRHLQSSILGFSILSLVFATLALSSSSETLLGLLIFSVGVGMGLPQPLLSAIMHLRSRLESPFAGIGLYSVALAIGIVIGPLASSFLTIIGGFPLVFGSLALVSVIGVTRVGLDRIRDFSSKEAPLETKEHSFSVFQWVSALRTNEFGRAFVANFLFSLLLPIYISFGGIFGEDRFGLNPASVLLLFSCAFACSALIRILLIRAHTRLSTLAVVGVVFLAVSFLIIGVASNTIIFFLGTMIFSVPHALILPIMNYNALRAVKPALVVNASYVFQLSSGLAEFLAPILASLAIASYGVSNLFLLMSPIAFLALLFVSPLRFQTVSEATRPSLKEPVQ
jgi:MFS family permease